MADPRQDGVSRLIVRVGDGAPLELRLGDTTMIGRDSDCDVCLSDPRISRLHCEITRTFEGYTVTDLGSQNGTFLNGERVTKCALRSGDVLKVGNTEMVYDTPSPALPVASAVKPSRVQEASGFWVLHCRTFYIVLTVVFLLPLSFLLVMYGEGSRDQLGSIMFDVGQWAGEKYAELTKPVPPPHPSRSEVVAEKLPRKETPRRKEGAEVAERDPVKDVEKREDSWLELSRRAIDDLRKRVMDALAAKDLELAESHIASFKRSDFYAQHLDAVRDIKEKISAIKREMANAERECLAAIEKRWKSAEAKVQQSVAAEKYDEAKDALQELLGDPDLASRAKALLASIENLKAAYIKETLPRRRDLFTEILLKMRPFLQKRDYAGASRSLDSLAGDSAFKAHLPLLDRERESLKNVGTFYQKVTDVVHRLPKETKITIVQKDGRVLEGKFSEVKDEILWVGTQGTRLDFITLKSLLQNLDASVTPPVLTLASAYLYDEDFENASLAIADGMSQLAHEEEEAGYNLTNDVLVRIEMTRTALMKVDLEGAIVEADRSILQGKYDKAKEVLDRVRKKYAMPMAEGIALSEGMSDQLPGLDEAYTRLEKVGEAKMAGGVPVSRLKVLKEKAKVEEKATLLKNLKVVGDKEVLPYVLLALKDESSRVRLEAVKTLSVLGTKESVWDLVRVIGDPIKEVGFEAVEGIRKIGYNPESIKKQFEKGTAEERRLAVTLAGNLRDLRLAPLAREALESEDWQMRMESAIALAKIKDKSSGSALVNALKKESADDVASALAYAIGAIKYSSGIGPISDLLKSKPGHPYKKELIRAIASIGGSSADDALKPYIRDLDDPWVRSTALEGIVESGGKLTLKEAKPLLADDNWLVRAGAIKGLIAGWSDESLETLVLALDDQNEVVRATVHHGLKSWKNAKVVPALLRKIDGLGTEGSGLAIDILKSLSGKEFATLSEWKVWWQAAQSNFVMPPVEQRFKPKLPVKPK